MIARWKDRVIAESDATVVVEGNHYFPPADIKQEYMRDSDHTSICGWKGTAHYYSIDIEGELNSDAAWYYPQPKSAAAEIAGYVAFWKGVQVSPD
jgi:uncharacterized protein (DUF427 family)